MATTTTNLALNIIEEHDYIDFQGFNENATIIDGAIGTLQDAVENIPTIESAITDLSNDMTTAENNITALGNRTSTIEGNITDINTVDTNQNTRITALENKAESFDLNGLPLDAKMKKTFIKTNVSLVADPYDNYRAIVTIPMSNFVGTDYVKVVSAMLYNDGLTIYGASMGANLVRATVRDNNLECVFVADTNFAVDGATAVITAIGY